MVLQKSGEMPKAAGVYAQSDRQGNLLVPVKLVRVEIGDKPMPPTSKTGLFWRLVIELAK